MSNLILLMLRNSWVPRSLSVEWVEDLPKFDGDPPLAISHFVNFLKYTSKINVMQEDVLMRVFAYSLVEKQ